MSDSEIPPAPASAPPPLVVAAGLVLVQGVLTVGYGIGELVNLQSDRLVMGLTTAAFFLLYGVGLGFCAWGLRRLRTWARGPVLFAQLVWLGLAWNFRGGETWPIAGGLAVPAVITLVGMLHPQSIDALGEAERQR